MTAESETVVVAEETWATIIIRELDHTRAISRHASLEVAQAHGRDTLKGDYSIVTDDDKELRTLNDLECDSLLNQFADPRQGLKIEDKRQVVKAYLAQFEPSWHKADGTAINGLYVRPGGRPALKPLPRGSGKVVGFPQRPAAVPPASIQTPMEAPVSTSTSETKKAVKKAAAAAKPAKPTAKGKAAKAAPVPRVKLQDSGDGLGREGTPARFIREQYKAGKNTDQIFEAVKKKFPKNTIKGKGYVSWYFNDMVKRGLIKKH